MPRIITRAASFIVVTHSRIGLDLLGRLLGLSRDHLLHAQQRKLIQGIVNRQLYRGGQRNVSAGHPVRNPTERQVLCLDQRQHRLTDVAHVPDVAAGLPRSSTEGTPVREQPTVRISFRPDVLPPFGCSCDCQTAAV